MGPLMGISPKFFIVIENDLYSINLTRNHLGITDTVNINSHIFKMIREFQQKYPLSCPKNS